MKITDTHCHIYLEEFNEDRDLQIRKAKDSGIESLLLPNVDNSTVQSMLDVCEHYPDYTYPMMGLHPTSIKSDYSTELSAIEKQLTRRPYCGIGEIGIDLYWDKTFLKEQKIAFEEQLRWSIDLNLPVAIHTRDAFPEVFDSLHKVGTAQLKGVFHSFTGSAEDLKEIDSMKTFMVGINGVVTFKNSDLSETLKSFDFHRILLETDAPYLSPVPFRGKRNEPIYIWKTAEKLSEIFGLPLETIAKVTSENTFRLFPIANKGNL